MSQFDDHAACMEVLSTCDILGLSILHQEPKLKHQKFFILATLILIHAPNRPLYITRDKKKLTESASSNGQ